MPRLRLYQVDAFTGRLFGGNPAAVVPLDKWLDDATMQAIGQENNLSETAFFVRSKTGFKLRWFTPEVEVKLCGHATLASAFVLFTELEPERREVKFETLSGVLSVTTIDDRLVMDFPRWTLDPVDAVPDALLDGLKAEPAQVLSTDNGGSFFAVFESEAAVRTIDPDFGVLDTLRAGVIATAPGEESDCVCRYFAPSKGVNEDPGTGSIHCALTPYWSERLRRNTVHSRQVSARGAELFCELKGNRVEIAGQAVKYLEGWIDV
ncbi:MAG TPA: PhzF family phenazine biosynthesis protein [Gammaproteobacteria bacterium]|nr:PhzF family phenazine biosynthesis protein [Gammaproteobacteria bacterium]